MGGGPCLNELEGGGSCIGVTARDDHIKKLEAENERLKKHLTEITDVSVMQENAQLREKVERMEKCRELVQRTVDHADNLLLDLPPEMVREFRAALAENKETNDV